MTASRRTEAGWWTRFKAFVVWLVARLVLATVRVRVLHGERLDRARAGGGPLIFAFWHGRQLGLFKANPARKLAVLASHSRDGAMQARICRRFGLEVVRGSSSRGGMAGLLALGRTMRRGCSVGMAVDGPRGPAFEAKPGTVALARAQRAPVVPITIGYRRRIQLGGAWDRFQIPVPFTRAVVAYGEPLQIDPGGSPEQVQELTARLAGSLRELTAEVDALAAEE